MYLFNAEKETHEITVTERLYKSNIYPL